MGLGTLGWPGIEAALVWVGVEAGWLAGTVFAEVWPG